MNFGWKIVESSLHSAFDNFSELTVIVRYLTVMIIIQIKDKVRWNHWQIKSDDQSWSGSWRSVLLQKFSCISMKRLNNEDFDQVLIMILLKVCDWMVKINFFDEPSGASDSQIWIWRNNMAVLPNLLSSDTGGFFVNK